MGLTAAACGAISQTKTHKVSLSHLLSTDMGEALPDTPGRQILLLAQRLPCRIPCFVELNKVGFSEGSFTPHKGGVKCRRLTINYPRTDVFTLHWRDSGVSGWVVVSHKCKQALWSRAPLNVTVQLQQECVELFRKERERLASCKVDGNENKHPPEHLCIEERDTKGERDQRESGPTRS